MNARARRFAVWLALLSVSLYALWPLLAMAQPRGHNVQYALCPHVSLHEIAVESGHQQPSSNPIWHNHQLQCVFSLSNGDGAAAAATAAIILITPNAGDNVFPDTSPSHFHKPVRLRIAAPRGPPIVS